MKSLRLLALTSCVAALSACNTVDGLVEDLRFTDWGAFNGKAGGKSENFLSDGCPQAAVVPELANFAEFTDNARPTTGSMVSHAQISSITSQCQFGPQSVTVDVKLNFEGTLGPQGRTGGQPAFSYPFFVAVTSPTGSILAKEIFAADMSYNSGDQQSYQESMRQIIPLPNKDLAGSYKILAGFQLSPEQLGYNRAASAADAAAAKERARVQRANDDAAKKLAADNDTAPEVIVVPDTTQ
ncbi:MAG: hypothetical protein KA155_02765 [Alphaproteobacteria bacterium]|jgi:predicted small secreted protein|nr:hypothetical protein [Alphaproteobacteria bacterium]